MIFKRLLHGLFDCGTATWEEEIHARVTGMSERKTQYSLFLDDRGVEGMITVGGKPSYAFGTEETNTGTLFSSNRSFIEPY